MNTPDEQAYLEQMEALWGPPARYSEYKRGDRITYRSIDTGHLKTGTIDWVAGAGRSLSGKTVPARYILGFDVVYLSEVIEGKPAEESTMVHCHWCNQWHERRHLDQCPLRPREA
jgi:hypothetical protein